MHERDIPTNGARLIVKNLDFSILNDDLEELFRCWFVRLSNCSNHVYCSIHVYFRKNLLKNYSRKFLEKKVILLSQIDSVNLVWILMIVLVFRVEKPTLKFIWSHNKVRGLTNARWPFTGNVSYWFRTWISWSGCSCRVQRNAAWRSWHGYCTAKASNFLLLFFYNVYLESFVSDFPKLLW